MAEGNAIRGDSFGYSSDFTQQLTAFADSNNELREIVKTLIETLKKSSSNSSSSAKKNYYDKDYERNIKALKNSTNAYQEVDKIIRQVSHDLYDELQQETNGIRRASLNKALEGVNSNLTKYTDTIGKINELQKKQQKEDNTILKMQAKLKKSYADYYDAVDHNNRELFRKKDQEITNIEASIKRAQKRREELDNQLQQELEYKQKLEDIKKAQAEVLRDSTQAITSLTSRMEEFRPESAKQWDNTLNNIKNFINPKNSDNYKSLISDIEKRLSFNKDTIDSIKYTNDDVNKKLATAEAVYTSIKATYDKYIDMEYANPPISEDDVEKARLELEELRERKEANELMIENLEYEAELLGKEKENLDKNASVFTNIQNTVNNFVKKTLTTAVDKQLDKLSSSASEVFQSFETLQKSLGKQLKMSAGEYDDMKQKLMEAANDAGRSIDVTQLNEAAASMTEMGISNTDLITNMAVGIAKLSEAGISAKMDEETVKQINAEFNRLIPEYGEEEAARLATQRFDEIIGIQEQLRQQYGDTIALENGGWQEILNWTSKLQSTGDLSNDEVGAFMASTANAMEAMTNAGISDPTLIFGELENILNGKMSDQNAWALSWMYNNGFDVNDTEAMYEKLASDQAGDLIMSFTDQLVNELLTGNATYDNYLKETYGASMTGEQLRSYTKNFPSASSTYANATFDKDSIKEFSDTVTKGIKEGTYTTATEQYNKDFIKSTQAIASKFQDMPDGDFWMSEGFGQIKSIVNNATEALINFLLSGNKGNLFGGSGSIAGTGSAGSGYSGSFLTGSAMSGNPAAYGGMAIGGAMSLGSAATNFSQAEDFEEGLYDTLTDPTFTSGLGTTLGSAAGGPIGGAVGGAIGALIPAISQPLERVASDIHDVTVENQELAASQLEEAAAKLTDAANSHANSANDLTDEIALQKQIFANYDDNQKEDFIRKQKNNDEEFANLIEGKGTNDAFAAAVERWIANLEKEKENENLLASGAEQLKGSFGQSANVDNFTAKWLSKAEGREKTRFKGGGILGYVAPDVLGTNPGSERSDMESRAAQLGMDLDMSSLSDTELAAALNAEEERLAEKSIYQTDAGYTTIQDAKTYAANKGKTNISTEEAMRLYLTDMDPDNTLYTEDVKNSIIEQAVAMDSDKANYDTNNEKFHKKLISIIDKNGGFGSVAYSTIFEQYKTNDGKSFNLKNVEDVDAVNVLSSGDIVINGSDKPMSESDLPDLPYSARNNHYMYDPTLYEGKYATGLEYVPFDDYIALLHQGEMVLNKSEAEKYRDSSIGGFDVSSITSSVDNQTNKLESILTKILQILTYKSTSGGSLPRSLVNMNSDISLL